MYLLGQGFYTSQLGVLCVFEFLNESKQRIESAVILLVDLTV